jgi:hypothetical protein
VGISKAPAARLASHIACRKAGSALRRWIHALRADHVVPQMQVQCDFPSRDKANLTEMLLVKEMKAQGVRLLNYVDIDHPPPRFSRRPPSVFRRQS